MNHLSGFILPAARGLAAAVLGCLAFAAPASADELDRIAKELSAASGKMAKPLVAIIPPSYIDGRESTAGIMISERLTTRLVKRGDLEVVERALLDKVAKEIKFQMSDFVAAESATRVGEMLGVEAVVTGTIMELDDDRVELNIRLIQTKTAKVLMASDARLKRFWKLTVPKKKPATAETARPSGGAGSSSPTSAAAPVRKDPSRLPIVVFERGIRSGKHKGDTDVAAQRAAADRDLRWEKGKKIMPIAQGTGREGAPSAIPDGHGGIIAAYEIKTVSGKYAGDYDVYAQRMDANGKRLWGGGKTSVPILASTHKERNPILVPDGKGGAFVIFEQELVSGKYKGDTDLKVRRVDENGKLVWGKDISKFVANSSSKERRAAAIPDGEGGVIVTFETEVTSGKYKGDVDIYAQRIDADGKRLWGEGKRSAKVAVTKNHSYRPAIVPDGEGGAIIVFEQYIREGKYAGDTDVYGQRIDKNGKMVWFEGKKVVGISQGTAKEYSIVAIPDGEGGAIVVFEIGITTGKYAGDTDIHAQRIDKDGKKLWADKKKSQKVASSTNREKAPRVVPDNYGGAIVVFESHIVSGKHKGDVDINAQRLSAEGKMLWHEGKKSAAVARGAWKERNPSAIPDGEGGVIVALEKEIGSGEDKGDVDVYAQRLDGAGKSLWGGGQKPIPMAATSHFDLRPVLVAMP